MSHRFHTCATLRSDIKERHAKKRVNERSSRGDWVVRNVFPAHYDVRCNDRALSRSSRARNIERINLNESESEIGGLVRARL